MRQGFPVYVRIRREDLYIRVISSKKEWREIPEIAIGLGREGKTVCAVGSNSIAAAAKSRRDLEIINPFSDSSPIITDSNLAAAVLQHAFYSVFGGFSFQPSPILVVHPLNFRESTLSKSDRHALVELGKEAGARKVIIWLGRELQDHEVGDPKFVVHPKQSV